MDGFDIFAVGAVVICMIGYGLSRRNPTIVNTIIAPLVVGTLAMIGLYILQ